MTGPGISIIATVALLASGDTASRHDRIAEWLQAAIPAARQVPSFGSVSVEIYIERHFDVRPARMANLRAEVEGKPDHPLRRDLNLIESYLKDGPRSETVLFQSDERYGWRFSTTYSDDGTRYLDFGMDKSGSWQMLPFRLTIDRTDGAPRSGDSPLINVSSARIYAGALMHGVLAFAPPDASLVAGSISTGETEWRAELSSQLGTMLITGRWDDSLGRGFATSLVRPPAAGSNWRESSVSTSDGWLYSDQLQRWIARESEFDFLGAPAKAKIYFVQAGPITESELQAIVAVPEAQKTDPIRGPTTFTKISDLRDDPRLSAGAAGPPVPSRVAAAVSTAAPSWPWWRIAAGFAALVTFGLIVLLRLRRGRA